MRASLQLTSKSGKPRDPVICQDQTFDGLAEITPP